MKVPKPRKLKSGTWFIQLRLNGVSVPVTAPTKQECIDQACLIKAEYKAGKRQIAHPDTITLRQAIDSYIESKKNVLSPSTIRSYRGDQRNRFQSVADHPLASVDDWQSVINNEATLCSPKSIKNAWGLVTSCMRANNITPPVVKLPQIVRADRPWLEPNQIPVFLEAIRGLDCEVPALLALHGLRRSELLGLTWDNIDLDRDLIRVSGSTVFDGDGKLVDKPTNKNQSSNRIIPIMIPELKNILEAVPEKNRIGKVVHQHPNTLYAQINRACKSANLPEVGCHGLRHSFASLSYHVGNSELETMRLGGWSDFATMRKIYTHLADSDKRKSENKITEFFQNAN